LGGHLLPRKKFSGPQNILGEKNQRKHGEKRGGTFGNPGKASLGRRNPSGVARLWAVFQEKV